MSWFDQAFYDELVRVKEGSFYGTRRKPQVNRPTRLDSTACFANRLDHGRTLWRVYLWRPFKRRYYSFLQAMQILFLISSCIKGDPQIPALKGRPRQQACFVPRNIRLYRCPVCSLSCQSDITLPDPAFSQDLMISEKPSTMCFLWPLLEKRNQSYDHAFRCALRRSLAKTGRPSRPTEEPLKGGIR